MEQFEDLEAKADTKDATDAQNKLYLKLWHALFVEDNIRADTDANEPLPAYMYQETGRWIETMETTPAEWLKANLPHLAPDEQKIAKQTAAWEDAHGASTLPDFPVLNTWSDGIQKDLPILFMLEKSKSLDPA